MAGRPQRKAKLSGVDYAVLSSGMQIPEYSSEEEESSDEAGGFGKKRKRRDGRRKKEQCFICKKKSKSPFVQCDNCSRLFHSACGRPFESASILGNTSCYECLQEARVSSMSELPRPHIESIADFVKILKKAKKIVVIAGAGISVSCGIPDFRSKDGIYNMARHMDVVLPEPECLFQIEYFRQDPSPFFQIVRNAFANSPVPSPTHRFLKLLEDKKKLLRVYTQNIDGLEEAAGVTKVIPCHGTFAWSTCMRCKKRVTTSSIMDVIQAGVIPTCSVEDCRGVLKPDITFFGEILDDKVSTTITRDRLQADLLLVMGTSLKVAPVMEIPGYLPAHIPQVVVNMTALKKKKIRKKLRPFEKVTQTEETTKEDEKEAEQFDLSLLGDCDGIVRYICEQAKWDLDEVKDNVEVKVKGDSSTRVKSECIGEKATNKKRGKRKDGSKPHIIEHSNGTMRKKVFCFGECHCDKRLAIGRQNITSESEPENEHVVCNLCNTSIEADSDDHYRCLDCFDYDLCAGCFTKRKHLHKGGSHRFSQVLS